MGNRLHRNSFLIQDVTRFEQENARREGQLINEREQDTHLSFTYLSDSLILRSTRAHGTRSTRAHGTRVTTYKLARLREKDRPGDCRLGEPCACVRGESQCGVEDPPTSINSLPSSGADRGGRGGGTSGQANTPPRGSVAEAVPQARAGSRQGDAATGWHWPCRAWAAVSGWLATAESSNNTERCMGLFSSALEGGVLVPGSGEYSPAVSSKLPASPFAAGASHTAPHVATSKAQHVTSARMRSWSPPAAMAALPCGEHSWLCASCLRPLYAPSFPCTHKPGPGERGEAARQLAHLDGKEHTAHTAVSPRIEWTHSCRGPTCVCAPTPARFISAKWKFVGS